MCSQNSAYPIEYGLETSEDYLWVLLLDVNCHSVNYYMIRVKVFQRDIVGSIPRLNAYSA